MTQILEFRQKTSNAYHNLTRLVEITENTATLDFYVGAVAVSVEEGHFIPGEVQKLTEQIGKKRLDLERPEEKTTQEVTAPGLYTYCPEMGESKPECQMMARMGHYGTHYYIDTPLTLKGRGITFIETMEEKNLTASGQFMTGWNKYKVTERAFQKLQEQYSISMKNLLD